MHSLYLRSHVKASAWGLPSHTGWCYWEMYQNLAPRTPIQTREGQWKQELSPALVPTGTSAVMGQWVFVVEIMLCCSLNLCWSGASQLARGFVNRSWSHRLKLFSLSDTGETTALCLFSVIGIGSVGLWLFCLLTWRPCSHQGASVWLVVVAQTDTNCLSSSSLFSSSVAEYDTKSQPALDTCRSMLLKLYGVIVKYANRRRTQQK